jgi:hypothetical protein
MGRDRSNVGQRYNVNLTTRVTVPDDNPVPIQFVMCPTPKNDGAEEEDARADQPHLPALEAKPEKHGAAKCADSAEKIQPDKLSP